MAQRLGFVLLGAGVLCGLAASVSLLSTRAFIARARRARGVVTALSEEDARPPRASIRFRTAEKQQVLFETRLAGNPSRNRVGRKVRVLYDPASPRQARLDAFRSLWSFPLWTGILALLAILPGAVILARDARRRARLRWVKKHGRPVATQFHTVIVDTSVSRHGRHPYRIVTRWKNLLTGIHYTFEGPHTWFDPEPYAARRPVIVRIHPHDPTCYDMDVSFLPEQGPESAEPDAREPVAGGK